MSEKKETRRSFLKGSVTKGIITTNAAALAGLINTPGLVQAGPGPGTTQPGTTQPTTTTPEPQPYLIFIRYVYVGTPGGGSFSGQATHEEPDMAAYLALQQLRASLPTPPENDPINGPILPDPNPEKVFQDYIEPYLETVQATSAPGGNDHLKKTQDGPDDDGKYTVKYDFNIPTSGTITFTVNYYYIEGHGAQ